MKLTYSIFVGKKDTVEKAIESLQNLDVDASHVIEISKVLKPLLEEKAAFEVARTKKAAKIVKPDKFGRIKLTNETPGFDKYLQFMNKLCNVEFEYNVTPIDISVISSGTGTISNDDISILKLLGIVKDPNDYETINGSDGKPVEQLKKIKEIDISQFDDEDEIVQHIDPINNKIENIDIPAVASAPTTVSVIDNSVETHVVSTNVPDVAS